MTEYTQPYFRIWSTSRDSGEKISSTAFKRVRICTLLLARLGSHFVLFMFRNLTSHLNFHFLRWVTFSQTICILFALVSTWNNSLTNHISEKAMSPHSSTLAWKIPWMEEPGGLQSLGSLSRTRLSDLTFTFHFHALEKEMATHSSVLAWRIPGTGEPGGLPSMGSHRVRHDWSDLAAAVAATSFISVFW